MIITALVCILPLINMSVKIFLLQHFWLALLASVISLVISCTLSCVPSVARTVPTNYILLLVFTLLEAYTVAFICATVKDSMIVLTAAVMTAALVVGLTLYAVFTKTDFT